MVCPRSVLLSTGLGEVRNVSETDQYENSTRFGPVMDLIFSSEFLKLYAHIEGLLLLQQRFQCQVPFTDDSSVLR